MTELQNLKLKYNGNRIVDGGRILAAYILDEQTAIAFDSLTINSKPRKEADGSWTILLPIYDLGLVEGQMIVASAELTPAFNKDGSPVIGKSNNSNFGKEIMNFSFTGVGKSQVMIDNTAKAEASAPAIFHLMNKLGCTFDQASALYSAQESAFNKNVADRRALSGSKRTPRPILDRTKTDVVDFLNMPKATKKSASADKVAAVGGGN